MPYRITTVAQRMLLAILVVLAASACSSPAASLVIEPADVGTEIYELGQTIYSTQCASCHGANGEGQFPAAPLQRDSTGRFGAPPHNDTGHTWHHDDALLVRVVRDGGMGDSVSFYPMPAFGSDLTQDEIDAVIAYIKTLWTAEQQAAQRERTLAVQSDAG